MYSLNIYTKYTYCTSNDEHDELIRYYTFEFSNAHNLQRDICLKNRLAVLGSLLLNCIQLQNTEYMPKNVICNVFRFITQSEYCILNTWITSTLNCIL